MLREIQIPTSQAEKWQKSGSFSFLLEENELQISHSCLYLFLFTQFIINRWINHLRYLQAREKRPHTNCSYININKVLHSFLRILWETKRHLDSKIITAFSILFHCLHLWSKEEDAIPWQRGKSIVCSPHNLWIITRIWGKNVASPKINVSSQIFCYFENDYYYSFLLLAITL